MAEYKLPSDMPGDVKRDYNNEKQTPEKGFNKEQAEYINPTPQFRTQFASLSMHRSDRLRLLDFPPEITPLVRQTINVSWPRGIQDEFDYAGTREFKLHGFPWHGCGDDSMNARRFMTAVFANLWNAGWIMTLSTDVSKKQADKDTLIFRRQLPPPPPCEWISISFSRNDRIRLMDAPRDLRDAMVSTLHPQVQDSRPYQGVPNTWEIKILGFPWLATGENTMTARRLLLRMVSVLEHFGFTVYASIDQKATTQEHRSESDTWHCRRSRDWIPGAPVYHT